MSITPWLPTVRKIRDGETVEQATVNVPIEQLTQREQHLYEKFEELLGKSVLTSFNQPIHPKEALVSDELNLVYFKSDTDGVGLARGVTGFSSSTTSSMFTPNNSNYTFGLLKRIYTQTMTADVYTEGLCELSVNIDDPIRGLLQKNSANQAETFEVGPYYLSNKSPGKITKDPSGIPVYVGYAISKRQFLLHTNVDEFSQFFINYRYHILDRVAGYPRLSDGTWTISSQKYLAGDASPVSSSQTVTASNITTRYVGHPATDSRGRIDKDTYTATVTTGGTLADVRFSVQSAASAFSLRTAVPLSSGNILNLDLADDNLVKLDLTGSTSFSIGDTATLSVYNHTVRLGWIQAADAGVAAPAGAVFYYNIPNTSILVEDTGLDYTLVPVPGAAARRVNFELDEANELRKYLPPVPANFIQLYLNGELVRYNDAYDGTGTYSLNEYGLWWHADADGEQPWSPDYPHDPASPAALDSWRTTIKPTTTAGSRKRIFASFAKFNPALRTQLVSSLSALNLQSNRAANFIKFYNIDGSTYTPGHTGDVFVDVDPQFIASGYTAIPFEYPAELTSTYTANRAIAALTYSKPDGAFKAVVTPVVAKVLGVGGISATEQQDNPGVWEIGYLSQGLTGQLDSIELINARLEFRELTSFIKLPAPSSTPYGIIGKIVLPRGYANNKKMNIVFHLFGDSSLDNATARRNVAFQFQYSAVSAVNGELPTNYNLVDLTKRTPAVNPVEFALQPSGATYAGYTAIKLTHPMLSIPAEFISADCVVNFKILRVGTANLNNSYAGNIGLLATYWEMTT